MGDAETSTSTKLKIGAQADIKDRPNFKSLPPTTFLVAHICNMLIKIFNITMVAALFASLIVATPVPGTNLACGY